MKCKHCGENIKENDLYCDFCGEKITIEEPKRRFFLRYSDIKLIGIVSIFMGSIILSILYEHYNFRLSSDIIVKVVVTATIIGMILEVIHFIKRFKKR